MKLLIGRINSAVEVDLSKANKDTVSFGAWVRFNGRVVRIVGVDEADIDKGLISFISPLAKSLMGKKAGDVIGLKGSEKLMVEKVSFEPMPLTKVVREKPSFSSLRAERGNPASEIATIKEEPMQTKVPQQEVQKEVTDLPAKADEPRKFEPETNAMEFLPIVNERGNIVGRAAYFELHKGNKLLHPVVHLHIINEKGATTRLYWWHVAFGETPEKTLKRKMAEILGLPEVKPKLKRQYIREAKNEKELVYVFSVVSEEDLPITPDGEEYIDVFAKD